MPSFNDNNVVLEDKEIIYRNFAGREGPYNQEGDRNFSVLLSEREAKQLLKDGWNVKTREGREEGDETQYYLQVSLKYRARGGRSLRGPRVVMITSRGRTTLGEDEVDLLDGVDVLTCDLIIRPFDWVMNGKSGTKAYLQSMFITIDEDPLERKYADLESHSGR